MAQFVLTDASITVAAVDLSDHVQSITLDDGADIVDASNMGDTYHARLGALKDWSVQVTFQQDFASGKVDPTLDTLVGTSVALVIKADSGAVSATNPSWSGNAILESYQIIGGGVGDLAISPVTFQGNGNLTRAEA